MSRGDELGTVKAVIRALLIAPTATDDVEHVQRLVRGQWQREPHFKSTRFPPAHERPALSAPLRSTAFSPSTQRDSLEQVKANLRVLLAEHLSNGINVRQLHETYTRRFGSQINYAAFGYRSFEEFRVRMSDIMYAERNSTGTTKVFLCKRSGLPIHADADLRKPYESTGQSFRPYTLPTTIGLQQQLFQGRPTVQSLKREVQHTGAVPKMWQPSRSRPPSHSFHPDIKPAGTAPPCHTGIKPGVQKVATQKSRQSRLNTVPDLDDEPSTDVYTLIRQEKIIRQNPARYEALCRMNPQVEKNIKKVLQQHPEGIRLKDLVKVYKEITGAELCPAEYGYNSVWDLILDFRHVVSITNPRRGGNCMIGPHENPTTCTLSSWAVNVLQLLLRLSAPRGLTVVQLLQAFQRVTGKTIDLKKCGLSTRAFVILLATGPHLTFENLGDGQVLITSLMSKGTRETIPIEMVGPTRTPEANESARTLRAMSGLEALRNSDLAEYVELAESAGSSDSSVADELEQMVMAALTSPTIGRVRSPPLFIANSPYARPEHLEVGKHYAVYVSQIYSVHHFYIQKKGLDASVRLEALMNQLDLVYNGPESSAYLMDDKLVHVGMACAASYTYSEGNSDWHRALVVGLDANQSTCQVLFIDYGSLTFLKKTELRFLRNDFFDLPPQAVRATMEYLKPVTSDGWTLDTKAAFIELASGDQTLVCKVLKRRGALHSVSLCITSDHSEAYVSDLLVEHHLALPTLKHKADLHSRGEPASKPVHHREPTASSAMHRCSQSAVRATAHSGGEPAVQSTPGPAVQPQFQGPVQPPLKPAMALGVPPSQFQTPLATEKTTNKPAHEAVNDEVDILDVLRKELDGPCLGRAVKPEHLPSGHCLMVVNYEGVPYLTTANVCQLLGWSSDVILERLAAKCIQFPTLVLKRDSRNYWIFNQMASCDVPGVKFEQGQPQEVTLIPLRNVIDLLNLFECTEPNLRREIVVVAYSFNPGGSYWLEQSASEEVKKL
ncbi:hypothetical protein MTO96_021037 [Rhipicephalus appendiculatus]